MDEAVAIKGLAQAPGYETVLGETEVEKGGHFGGSIAQLLLLLNVVGAADLKSSFLLDCDGGKRTREKVEGTNVSDGALVSQPREQLVHLGGGRLIYQDMSLAIDL